jgi:hypothetical protein
LEVQLGDEGSGDDGFESGFSTAPNDDPFGSNPSGYFGLNSATSSFGVASTYDTASRALEASISGSAAPGKAQSAGVFSEYVGISGSVVTPVGGAEIDAGFYSDSHGMVGSFFSLGPAMGVPGGSFTIVSGNAQGLAGESVSVAAGLGLGVVGITKAYIINPSTGDKSGEQWSAGLSVGSPVAISAAYTSTTTTEFTSLYLAYIQFLNWVGYSGY